MLIQLFIICLLRYASECMVETYNTEAVYCNELLHKAKQTQVESIRNAYCVEVVDADQTAVLNTLTQYYIPFLASNQTYATFAEVLHYSCRVPYAFDVVMRWTSGIIPLTVAYVLYSCVQGILSKMKRPAIRPSVQQTVETERKLDAPPIFKQRRVRREEHKRERPVTRIKTPEVKQRKNLSQTTEALVSSLNSDLRLRILGTDNVSEV